MGAHWTCACPPPGNTERIDLIPRAEWDKLFKQASALLSVTQNAYPESAAGYAIQCGLSTAFDVLLPDERKVQRMPLACQVDEYGQRRWVSSDSVLGPLLVSGRFELLSDMLCRRLMCDPARQRISGAQVDHLPTGRRETIQASVVIVAADTLRTPQLLWASGIRPRALGHYLNDQPQQIAGVMLSDDLLERARLALGVGDKPLANAGESDRVTQGGTEPIIGIFWVPFHDPVHPYHGQVVHINMPPNPANSADVTVMTSAKHLVGLGWFSRKEPRYEDYIDFADSEFDYVGMPKMRFQYALTSKDEAELAGARQALARAIAAFGASFQPGEPFMLSPGSSLHYQGTTRIGLSDDGTCVCDPYSQVWVGKICFSAAMA